MRYEDIKMTLDIYIHLNDQNKVDAINSIRELNI